MTQQLNTQKVEVTLEAFVTRADGTVEDFGVIASTEDGTVALASESKD